MNGYEKSRNSAFRDELIDGLLKVLKQPKILPNLIDSENKRWRAFAALEAIGPNEKAKQFARKFLDDPKNSILNVPENVLKFRRTALFWAKRIVDAE